MQPGTYREHTDPKDGFVLPQYLIRIRWVAAALAALNDVKPIQPRKRPGHFHSPQLLRFRDGPTPYVSLQLLLVSRSSSRGKNSVSGFQNSWLLFGCSVPGLVKSDTENPPQGISE